MLREDFCPVCVVAAGSVIAGGGALNSGKTAETGALYKKAGAGIIVSSIALFVFYRYFSACKTCSVN